MTKNHFIKSVIVLVSITFFAGCGSSSKKKEMKDAAKKEAKKMEDKEAVTIKVVKKKAPEKPHWSYQGLFGPSLWGNLDPSYAKCKDGKSQSPVDLVWKKPVSTRDLVFNYKSGPLAMADTGHSVLVMGTKDSNITIAGEKFDLVAMHIHSPSEHTLSGKSFAAEAHFVHKNAQGQLAVVGVLINEGNSNDLFRKIVDGVPTKKKQVKKAGSDFNPADLLPLTKTHYAYSGSLTTPPCSEGVNWTVLNTPISISKEQLAKLRSFYNDNNRPVQPLNGRSVVNH